MEQNEFELHSDNRVFVVYFIIFFGPLLGIELVMAFWMDSLALKCLFIPLAILIGWMLSVLLRSAKTKLVLTDHTVSIVSGRKSILPVTDLHDFGAVYFLDLTWRYTGKYRVGDPIGKEVWNSLRYCVFSRAEISDEALTEIAYRLRKKRPQGAIAEGLAFLRDEQYFPLMKTYISENSMVFEKKLTLKPSPY